MTNTRRVHRPRTKKTAGLALRTILLLPHWTMLYTVFMKLYGITLSIFLVIDIIWLSLVAKNFYADQIGFLMKSNVNWVAAIVFYLLFVAGLIFFVISPALDKQSWSYALMAGAFFGLLAYATYDLTNLATIKDWPLLVTGVDLVWGMVLSGSVSVLSFLIYSRFVQS